MTKLHRRTFGEIGRAEIAGDGFGDEGDVLLANRPVKAPKLAYLLDLLIAA